VKLDGARIEQSYAFRKASAVMMPPAHAIYEIPRLTKTPWEMERYKRNSIWRRTPNETLFPRRVFEQLPREVYDCVLTQLELIHLSQNQPCPACYMKDLHSLSLTSRAWDRAATLHMYVSFLFDILARTLLVCTTSAGAL
jgi:hypothetical protein